MTSSTSPLFTKDNFRFLIKELIKTLSNQKGYFSSKRLERFTLFWMASFIVMNYYRIHAHELTNGEIIALTGTLFAYAGFNTIMNNKEKKQELLDNAPADQELRTKN